MKCYRCGCANKERLDDVLLCSQCVDAIKPPAPHVKVTELEGYHRWLVCHGCDEDMIMANGTGHCLSDLVPNGCAAPEDSREGKRYRWRITVEATPLDAGEEK